MSGLLLASILALASPDSLLVPAEWLAANATRPGVVVLHVAMNRAEYDRGHIPGARYLDPHKLMEMGPPGVELPSVAAITATLEELGVSPGDRIVYYGDTWMTPRVFLALESVGLGDRSALLDGGLPAWREGGRPLSTEPPTWNRTKLSLTANRAFLAQADGIKGRLADSSLVLLDVRSAGEYSGADTSEGLPRSGHIPGGVNLPWEETFVGEGTALDGTPSKLKSKAALRALLASAGVRDGRQLVVYCTVGLRASHVYFVARYLGLPARIYDGSMNEWSRRPELPMVRGPSPR